MTQQASWRPTPPAVARVLGENKKHRIVEKWIPGWLGRSFIGWIYWSPKRSWRFDKICDWKWPRNFYSPEIRDVFENKLGKILEISGKKSWDLKKTYLEREGYLYTCWIHDFFFPDTFDGRNRAPVDMVSIPIFTGVFICIPGSFLAGFLNHQPYPSSLPGARFKVSPRRNGRPLWSALMKTIGLP